jgi:hypothetical protein
MFSATQRLSPVGPIHFGQSSADTQLASGTNSEHVRQSVLTIAKQLDWEVFKTGLLLVNLITISVGFPAYRR